MTDASAPKTKRSERKRSKKRRFRSIAQIRAYNRADWLRAYSEIRKSVPGLGISLLIHSVLLLVMAWFVIRKHDQFIPPLELGWSTIVESEDQEPPEESVAIEAISIPDIPLNQESTVKPPTPELEKNVKSGSELKLVDVSQALSLRANRDQANKENKDGAETGIGREAIENALWWIVRQQEQDGRWRLDGDYADAGTITTDTGATSLALLALLGDGHTHRTGDYLEAVENGLQWLIKQQKENGDLFDIEEQGREAHFYSHAQGTIALCEALAMTGDETLRGPAERAIHFLESAQNPVMGGWKYRPLDEDGIGDLSVTGWALMALQAARMAQIDVDFNTFLLAEEFLDSVQEEPSVAAYYKYRPDFPIADAQRQSMTAEGLLCRQWLGWPRDEFSLRIGVEFLTSEVNRPEWKPRRRNVYAWYYTAQVLHNLGGDVWQEWFSEVLPLIVKFQHKSGPHKGSWHPNKPPGAFQERSHDAGRLYLTVMSILILETPYRHAPLYEAAGLETSVSK